MNLCNFDVSNSRVLYNVLEDFPKAHTCAKEVQKFLEKRLKAKINQQELVYLTIHLNRLEMVYHQ